MSVIYRVCNCGCGRIKSFGTSPYTGISEDIDMPIIRTRPWGTGIEDVPEESA